MRVRSSNVSRIKRLIGIDMTDTNPDPDMARLRVQYLCADHKLARIDPWEYLPDIRAILKRNEELEEALAVSTLVDDGRKAIR